MAGIQKAAQIGFSSQAGTYAKGRPSYPIELQAWLMDELGIDSESTVIDLGAGTGKFTRLLNSITRDVVAIEPVEAMRAEFSKALPDLSILNGTAECIPVDSSTAEAVVCAQAFHWFASESALAEIHRVLKPGGRLGMIWNVRDESVDWVAAITDIMTPYEGDTPRFHTGLWRAPFSGPHFSEPQMTCFKYVHSGSPQEVILDRFLSVSFIAALPPADKANVTEQLHALIATHPSLKGREIIEFPYQTQAYLCHRINSE
ncbi:class I SAM-dependent methyltransferase [Pseudomonas sp. CDFA 602]|uniref:class I SAM-dependent methyltransferase n=1 Tax=Pseudomonas californiensis TaxID=2829823 RepID=UPI001E4E4C26|nr:class I SAM-dependent methyltransferase [Pseudomonas californiensis]MCD5994826.1 class I SAM-dependent methyltransferase [Pseudomonas californiensis]MCD6000543.1 class I SAM-dependent methyltransferase [Pseudomonas californiensis]